MSDILPVKREHIEAELEAENPTPIKEEVEEVEDEPVKEKSEEDYFIKPKKDVVVELDIDVENTKPKPKKKKKRQLSQLQLDNLAKAREKSVAKRKAIKEAKAIERKAVNIKKEKIREEKRAKREQEDEMIELKAQLKLEAETSATWSEERLQKLINSSIDNYIEKKKSMKPVPRVSIPAPSTGGYVPNGTPLHPKYYMPQPNYQQPNYQYLPSAQQQHQQYNNNKDPALKSLFGNYE